MADNDDDRDERDSDAPEPKKQAKGSKAKKEPASEMEQLLAEVKEIKKQLVEARAQQYPHLWLLFPIAALLAIQTIFAAMNL